MSYLDVAGVQTWYAEHGSGDPLVLLHGGFSDASEFGGMTPALAGRFRVLTPERRGHGHTPDVTGPISYELMAADTVAFLDKLKIGRSHLVGHSDGANVALLVALSRPDLVDRLVLISGNFHHDGLVADLDLNELAANDYLADAYGQISPDGRGHFPVIAAKIFRMATTEPTLDPADLAKVAARTLVMAGDDDMVSAEHTLLLYRGITDSELAVVPGTSHALIIEKPGLCNQIILDFLTKDPAPTFMPIRRS
ncbi:MAG: alpha/beta hydrolase [Trebonia sp.]|jgi:pimeloyl-ACP methyl ester carboxylesterase